MVQAVNLASVSSTKQSFGCNAEGCPVQSHYCYRRPSITERVLGSAARTFVAGAAISATFDGVGAVFNALSKKPVKGLYKFGDIAKRAGIWGACWVAASAVLALIFPSRR